MDLVKKLRLMPFSRAWAAALTMTVAALAAQGCQPGIGDNGGDKSESSGDQPDEKAPSDDTATAPTTSDGSLASDQPADSTGAMAPVSLQFGASAAAAALSLLQGPATLDVGGGIVLSDARISLGSIKIKANKEESDDEKKLKDEGKAAEEAAEAEIKGEKEALEQQKEDLKKQYEPLMEGAADADKDALKAEMETKLAALKEQEAVLEKAKEDAASDDEAKRDKNLKWKGPFVYDLVTGAVTPELPAVELVDGSYRRIEFKLKPNRTADGADAILNNSVHVAGTVTLNGVATPFSASFPISEEFKLMGAGAFKVDPAVENALTVMFNASTWFQGVDFGGATPGADGSIIVDSMNNKALFDAIRKNIKSSTRFGEDEDHDGKLGDDESKGDGQEAVDAEDEAATSTENSAE